MLQHKKIFQYVIIFVAASGLTLSGCNDVSDNDSQQMQDLTLQFQTASSSSTTAKSSVNKTQQAGDSLRIEGSNGSLIIDDIRFIVEDFKLERADGECEGLEDTEEDDCEEFESEPFFVDLPLHGDVLDLDTVPVEPGLYEELEFEIDDLELDEEEEDEEDGKQQLINQVRSEFPDWPNEVSMVLIGSFISNEGDVRDFKTFAEAEVEVELEFNPPFEINENSVNNLVRVNIDPVRWFLQSDGSVLDLSEFDFESSGQILEFEVEIENGFESIETDDEEENDDDND